MNYAHDQVKEGCLDSQFAPLNLDTRGGDFPFVIPENEASRFERRGKYLNAMTELSGGLLGSKSSHEQKLEGYRNDALTMMQSPQRTAILRTEEEEKRR